MTPKAGSTFLRFLVVWAILGGTAVFLRARNSFEYVPTHERLEDFPRQLQGWTGQDLPMESGVLKVLGAGEFLNRAYRNEFSREFVELFVAYYPSQRSGDTIHSPQNCLPGSGWTPLRRDYIQIVNDQPQRKTALANRFVFAKGMERVYVLYWYQAHGRTTPSEYWAKFYLVRDSIALNRSDGAIVRIVTPIANAGGEAQAGARAVAFAQRLIGKLDDYVPR
jgi:EpsI family protein